MSNPQKSDDGRVIVGALVLIAALGATEALLYLLGGLTAAIATPVIALLWWTGYRMVTVPAGTGTPAEPIGNAGGPELVQRERPRADEPHTW